VYRLYRRWGLESAALDLALRQAGRPLHELLEREPRPVRFVVSSRLGEPPSFEPVARRLAVYPDLRFKLDATPSWDDALIARLVGTGAVDAIDFKGAYRGTTVDVDTDPDLYRRVAEAFPDAWLEDPDLTDPAADAALAPTATGSPGTRSSTPARRSTPLAFPPRTVNLKPSRFGSLEALFAGYDYCEARGIGAYGGGQYELAAGRGQIQYLASLFHADGPNDIAPGGFDALDPAPGLPTSPLTPELAPTGFRWASDAA
jgi:L-alanine-DL-glutamate epimerase-like enolase superfamily enzyme